jgi:predicted ATPase/DNA-binding SARP family transcriptional activator
MDPRCRIELLGPLRLTRGGETHTRFGTQKAAALLAYFALHPDPHAREQIIDLFWPDMDLPEGRNNLSTALSGLRRLLEPPGIRKGAVLVTTHAQAGLDPVAVTTDVADFERRLRAAEKAEGPEARAGLWASALALYVGPFQEGNYQDWAIQESERLEARRVAALDAWGDDLEALGRYADAADVTRQRLAADPYAETAQVALVRRQVRAGRLAAARETARKFEQLFEEEFGTGPDAETRCAIAAIFAQAVSPSAEPPAIPVAAEEMLSEPRPLDITASPEKQEDKQEDKATLPFWLSRFFGREAEMAHLAALLLPAKAAFTQEEFSQPEYPTRLLTLSGPGGAGKTRLAAEFGRRASERFGQWVGFVPLADLIDPAQIPARIAQSLGLPPAPPLTPREQVVSFFAAQDKLGAPPALLILDNMEHLLGPDALGVDSGALEIVRALLETASGPTILCTSRRRLGLVGERQLPLGPLPVPDTDDVAADLASLARVPSVRLYVDRAQMVRPDFGLTPTNAPAVAALCRILEGSPLALELAASWVRLLPPRRMWERLNQGQDIPEGRLADLTPRHRSLAAALDWSWRLLPPDHQCLLARLSVFRGGWTLEAAEAVCAAPDALEGLAALVEASLVTAQENADGDVRYGLLETIRQYAALKRTEEDWAVRDRHLAWCLALARDAEAEMRSPRQAFWLARLETEHDNLRAGLEWAAEADHPEPALLGLSLSGALSLFWLIRGHFQEGRTRTAAILCRSDAQCPTQARAEALNTAAMMATEQADLAAARFLHEEALAIRRALGDLQRLCVTLNNLAIVTYDQGDGAAARALWEESLAVARETGFDGAIPHALANLGELAFEEGDAVRGRSLLEEALAMHRATGSKYSIAYLLKVLTTVVHHQGDLAAARSFLAESLPLLHESGHRMGIAQTLEAAAAVAQTSGQANQAARLSGAAAALREEIAAPLPANERGRHEETLAAARTALGEQAFQQAFGEGRKTTWENALDQMLTEG